jgi:hypothetical protein
VNTRKYLLVIISYLLISLTTTAQAAPVNPKIVHLLDRLTLGIKPGEIDRVRQMGVDRYIQQQLNPDSIAESPIVLEKLAKLDAVNRQHQTKLYNNKPDK